MFAVLVFNYHRHKSTTMFFTICGYTIFSYLPFYILKQQHVSIVCNFTRVLLTGAYKLMEHCCQYFLLLKLLIFVVYHSHSTHSRTRAHTHSFYLSLSFACPQNFFMFVIFFLRVRIHFVFPHLFSTTQNSCWSQIYNKSSSDREV